MCEGIVGELLGMDLGDERLNRRSVKVLEALAANPQASVNGACAGWADTLAVYRLFQNEAVTPERILEPHRWRSHCSGCRWKLSAASASIAGRRVWVRRSNAFRCPSKRRNIFAGSKTIDVCELACECPGTRIVRVVDREADQYDIFVEAPQEQERDGPHADERVCGRSW